MNFDPRDMESNLETNPIYDTIAYSCSDYTLTNLLNLYILLSLTVDSAS